MIDRLSDHLKKQNNSRVIGPTSINAPNMYIHQTELVHSFSPFAYHFIIKFLGLYYFHLHSWVFFVLSVYLRFTNQSSYHMEKQIISDIHQTLLDSNDPKALASHLSKRGIFDLCEERWKSGYLEEAAIAYKWAESQHKQYKPTDFKTFEHWVHHYITNWADCDTLCNHTTGTFVMMFQSKHSCHTLLCVMLLKKCLPTWKQKLWKDDVRMQEDITITI